MERQPKPTVLIAAARESASLKDSFRNEDGTPSTKNRYIQKLLKYDISPIIVTNDMSEEEQDTLYKKSSGLLIPGGVDIDPVRYGQKPNPKLMKIDSNLDELQLTLTKKTLGDGKPFLGICRGAQILAVASEGTLIQHLPDKTNEKHGLLLDEQSNVQEARLDHEVIIFKEDSQQKPTKAFEIFKTTHMNVPSRHHQAVENPGKNIIISGKSPGGITEIIEHTSLPFHIGIQSHPELADTMDDLFGAYANAVKKYYYEQTSQLSTAA